ncbi:MAG: MFS transporter [Anaerolineales bacterium]|nr:MFS transporter [Anaerolineales bacterium]MCX7756514.1 MFS transporter [Anaerolineales bacterium]MDW8276664.1 MFS transporter [Anaerolineales bacterium]
MNLLTRFKHASRELVLFAAAALVLGMALSIVNSTFNNFLNERFHLTGFERSFLEFPRELPGFLVVFVSAALWFLGTHRLGVFSMLLAGIGAFLIGFASPSYWVMVVWLFIYSMGDHLFMPIASTIGMQLARKGQDGRRLGQINSIRNAATILGSFLVFVGFRYLGFSFPVTFGLAAAFFLLAAYLLYRMTPERTTEGRSYLQLHREYKLYYALNVISGARKQIFITFAPWVLVQVFEQPTQIMATLYTIGGLIGILFQPLLGWTIDRFGERFVLAADAVILVFVCFGYGFAKFIFPPDIAFLVVCAMFLLDQMIFSVSMARATYIKKIAREPGHIQPALTAAVTIDHVFSISAALVGGLVWNALGFQYVFLLGAALAVVNLFTALRVKLPQPQAEAEGAGA